MINIPDCISGIVLKGFDNFKINDILIFMCCRNSESKKYYSKGGFIFNFQIIGYEYILELVEMNRKI